MLRAARHLPRTVFALVTLVACTLAVCPPAYLAAKWNPRSRLLQAIVHGWAAVVAKAAGLRVEVTGREHFEPGRSYMVTPNHLSNLDVMVHVLAVPNPARFLGKKELFRIPIFGPTIRAVGVVETDRQGGRAAHAAINRQVEEVVTRHGRSLIVYPEGTRSREGRLQPFKKGAFHLAIRFGMPVVPCATRGTWEAWKPGDWRMRGGPVEVRFFEPIATEGLNLGDAAALQERVEAIVSGALEADSTRG